MLLDFFLDNTRPKVLTLVHGDSMSECNIEDGDLVVAFLDEVPNDGDIAIIEFRGKRYVKRIYKSENRICCRSESKKDYKDFYVNREFLTMLSKVVYVVKAVKVLVVCIYVQ